MPWPGLAQLGAPWDVLGGLTEVLGGWAGILGRGWGSLGVGGNMDSGNPFAPGARYTPLDKGRLPHEKPPVVAQVRIEITPTLCPSADRVKVMAGIIGDNLATYGLKNQDMLILATTDHTGMAVEQYTRTAHYDDGGWQAKVTFITDRLFTPVQVEPLPFTREISNQLRLIYLKNNGVWPQVRDDAPATLVVKLIVTLKA